MERAISDRLSDNSTKDELPESLEEGETALKIPNKEIREIFESTVKKFS